MRADGGGGDGGGGDGGGGDGGCGDGGGGDGGGEGVLLDFALLFLLSGDDYLEKVQGYDHAKGLKAYRDSQRASVGSLTIVHVEADGRLTLDARALGRVLTTVITATAAPAVGDPSTAATASTVTSATTASAASTAGAASTSTAAAATDDGVCSGEAASDTASALRERTSAFVRTLLWCLHMYHHAACPDYAWEPVSPPPIHALAPVLCDHPPRRSTALCDHPPRRSTAHHPPLGSTANHPPLGSTDEDATALTLHCPGPSSALTLHCPSALTLHCPSSDAPPVRLVDYPLVTLPAAARELLIWPLRHLLDPDSPLAHCFAIERCETCAALRGALAPLSARTLDARFSDDTDDAAMAGLLAEHADAQQALATHLATHPPPPPVRELCAEVSCATDMVERHGWRAYERAAVTPRWPWHFDEASRGRSRSRARSRSRSPCHEGGYGRQDRPAGGQ
jgi:hypothetical protein